MRSSLVWLVFVSQICVGVNGVQKSARGDHANGLIALAASPTDATGRHIEATKIAA